VNRFLLLVAMLFSLAGGAQAQPAAGTQSFTTSDGTALHVEVSGKGPVALFLHGGPGSGTAGLQRLMGPLIEGSFTVVWLDQRGSGRSANAGGGDYTLERQLKDFEELRAQLGVPRWTVIAYSFGGILAQAYASAHPDAVRSLVLANAILDLPRAMTASVEEGGKLLPAPMREQIPAQAPLPARYGMTLGMLRQAGQGHALQYASLETQQRAAAATAGLPRGNGDFARAIFASHPGAYLKDWSPETARTTVPVLVIAGIEDHAVGADAFRAWRYPDQTTVVLPGRHFTFVEAPAAFESAVKTFAQKATAR
jgi:proline iminopeptidase